MSRYCWIEALACALDRPPTEKERADFLAAMARVSGGEYVYVPKLPQSEVDEQEICGLRDDGMSYRDIAARLHCSQATIARAIRQRRMLSNSPYDSSAQAA